MSDLVRYSLIYDSEHSFAYQSEYGEHRVSEDGEWVEAVDALALEEALVACRRQLAEARAALVEVERRFTMTYRVPRYAKQWQERHAAAIQAAREAK